MSARPTQDPLLLAQIVATSEHAVFSEDLSGAVTSWNAASTALFGPAADEALGHTVAELVPAGPARALRTARAAVLAGASAGRADTSHVRPDGSPVVLALSTTALRDAAGVLTGVATSVQDVTDRASQETQNLTLTTSNRDLEQFAFVASHDLSEPLRAVAGFAQLLERRHSADLDEQALGYLGHVVDGAARMRTLIDDLLEYSRYLVDPVTAEVDTTAVAHEVVAALRAVGVDVAALPPVRSTEASVHAVLQNLIANAVKFHRPGAETRVEVSGRTDGERVVLCVDDDGIGIDPDYRQQVFEMFARLHVREEYAGAGIGLATVRQIAERSGGTAWVEDSHLGGSRFCVTLPGVVA